MVDKTILAARIAAVRDAVGRIRSVLTKDPAAFSSDRTAREVVILNLFVALQECLALATHWIADAGLEVPGSYRDLFTTLGEREVVSRQLGQRLAAASGLRNLRIGMAPSTGYGSMKSGERIPLLSSGGQRAGA